jgi:hypothetical protein
LPFAASAATIADGYVFSAFTLANSSRNCSASMTQVAALEQACQQQAMVNSAADAEAAGQEQSGTPGSGVSTGSQVPLEIQQGTLSAPIHAIGKRFATCILHLHNSAVALDARTSKQLQC